LPDGEAERETAIVNSRAFACIDCNQLIDTGYRWCQWQSEDPGTSALGERVDIAKVPGMRNLTGR